MGDRKVAIYVIVLFMIIMNFAVTIKLDNYIYQLKDVDYNILLCMDFLYITSTVLLFLVLYYLKIKDQI